MNNQTKIIRNAKEVVTVLMKKVARYRDNDEKLVAAYWWHQLKEAGININNMSAIEFLQYYAEGNLTTADTIVRARAKAQQSEPEVRGQNWVDRHEAANKVSNEITKI